MAILYLSHWQNIKLDELNIEKKEEWKEVHYIKEVRDLLTGSKFDYFVVQVGFPNETIAELLKLVKSRSLKTIMLCRGEISDEFKKTQTLLGFDHLCNMSTIKEIIETY